MQAYEKWRKKARAFDNIRDTDTGGTPMRKPERNRPVKARIVSIPLTSRARKAGLAAMAAWQEAKQCA